MTLGDFLQLCAQNPVIVVFYYVSVTLTALLAGILGRGEGHMSPWKYLYTFLVYAVAIPGLFAITLTLYLLLFESQSLLEWNVVSQILPIAFMFLIIWIIKRNVDLDLVPGFGKVGSLAAMILVVLAILWLLDRTRIFVVTFLPFQYVILLLILLMVVARTLWVRVFSD